MYVTNYGPSYYNVPLDIVNNKNSYIQGFVPVENIYPTAIPDNIKATVTGLTEADLLESNQTNVELLKFYRIWCAVMLLRNNINSVCFELTKV
jgi:hypothetical protein